MLKIKYSKYPLPDPVPGSAKVCLTMRKIYHHSKPNPDMNNHYYFNEDGVNSSNLSLFKNAQ
jgi:hypothetical protein